MEENKSIIENTQSTNHYEIKSDTTQNETKPLISTGDYSHLEDNMKVPTEEERKELIEEDSKEPAVDNPKAPAEEDPKEPAEEDPKEPAEEDPKEPVEEDPKEPAEEDPKKPAEEDPKEPVEEDPKETTVEARSDEFNIDVLKEQYKENNYLLFGSDHYEPFVDTTATLSYLVGCGFGNNGLKQARTQTEVASALHANLSMNEEGTHYCDFCGAKLGAEYDVLNDGRERCYQCSRTVVKTVDELEKVFIEVIKNMESLFGISYYTSIDVKTVNAKKLARKLGIPFISSPGYDGRVLGYAQDDKGTYHVCLENQSPYLCAVATMAHELTHIWQYLNWNERLFKKRYYPILKKKFPKISPRKIVYEGMAKWIEIQYLFLINEKDRAYLETAVTLQRQDEYGIGLAIYMNEYTFDEDTFISGATPFDDKRYPLHNIG